MNTANPLAWNYLGVFPPPQPVLEPRKFRIAYGTHGNTYTVWMADGTHTTFEPASFGWEELANYDDGGTFWNPLTIFTFTAQIDPSQSWWLRDDTLGQDYPIGETDFFGGWQPLHSEPPPSTTFTLKLLGDRVANGVVLQLDPQNPMNNCEGERGQSVNLAIFRRKELDGSHGAQGPS